MEQYSYLGSLLHLADSTLPIGGYTHSAGLETFVQQGIVFNAATAGDFVRNMLQHNLHYNDAAFMSLAYTATQQEDLELLQQWHQTCTASKVPKEIREASLKLGTRLSKIFSHKLNEFATAYEKAVDTPHYCMAFGVYASLLAIPHAAALQAFYYNAAVGMVTNCVKLIPLGQMDGQDILFELQPLIHRLTISTMEPDMEKLGLCNPGFDIRCMQHERLYSRLYIS